MDKFDEAAREISWPTPGDPERRIRLTPHGADAVARALRNNWNAALESAVMWHVRRVEFNRGARNADIRRRHQGYADAIRTLKVLENEI